MKQWKLPKQVDKVVPAFGWNAEIGGNRLPVLFWAITEDLVVHGVVEHLQELKFAESMANFQDYKNS